MEELKKRLLKYKYPAIILLIGIIFIMMPTGADSAEQEVSGEAELLKGILAKSEGIGRLDVIISDKGVVVVCDGANDANVRLNIIRAVSSYTGFTSDKISILRMTDQ